MLALIKPITVALATKALLQPRAVIAHASNPGFRFRIAHHIDFPDYSDVELLEIAELMLHDMNYRLSPDTRQAFVRYIALRKAQPLFSNARSIRNALDRMRLRQGQPSRRRSRPRANSRRHNVARGFGCTCQPGVLERLGRVNLP
jgi:AAA lid domain